MSEVDFSYCVAIRTLGKAGDKFQRELDSIIAQTIPPRKIIIYLAEGYEPAAETVGCEQYVVVPKGMVAQRALPYDEVDTDYVLLLDDDVYLPSDAVEKMYRAIKANDGDCIAPDIFENHKMSMVNKVRSYATNMVYPRLWGKWAFRIGRNSSFSYKNNPREGVYESQCAGGPASLWRTDALRGINYVDEKWLDSFPFAYGDEMLFFYKLYANGGKLLVSYASGVLHLDAGTGRKSYKDNKDRLLLRSQIQFILWWRTSYDRADRGFCSRVWSALSYFVRLLHGFVLHLAFTLVSFSVVPLRAFFRGNIAGYRYVHSGEYKSIPNFIINK